MPEFGVKNRFDIVYHILENFDEKKSSSTSRYFYRFGETYPANKRQDMEMIALLKSLEKK